MSTVLSASSEPEVKMVAAWVVPEKVKGRRARARVARGDFMVGIWRFEIEDLGIGFTQRCEDAKQEGGVRRERL